MFPRRGGGETPMSYWIVCTFCSEGSDINVDDEDDVVDGMCRMCKLERVAGRFSNLRYALEHALYKLLSPSKIPFQSHQEQEAIPGGR